MPLAWPSRVAVDTVRCPFDAASAMLGYVCSVMPTLGVIGNHGHVHDVRRRQELVKMLIHAVLDVEVCVSM